ncbi:unnamed protein product [Caenorhabditis auriculariae]|uniref:Fungal lipase-type domain-containing protein n=1 Tax=Caenorhabditis auriculariae TaxID=2777116 RepID=A0A8S1HEL3_9PELO|nr:unnamed protein product [Caenorhabditis auriculariae]
MQKFVYFLLFFCGFCYAGPCEDCLTSGKEWCASVGKCGVSPCPVTVKRALNCPSLPDAAHSYDDSFIRANFLPLIGGAHADDPYICLRKNAPTMVVYNTVRANCTGQGDGPQTPCFMYTAYDTSRKIILMAFRGTSTPQQLIEEILNFSHKKKPFFDVGYIFDFFYDAFIALWNNGLSSDIRNLKYLHPDYELWVTGHSLGGALSSIAASYVVKIGLFQGQNTKLLTMGQPRTGDYKYALWHQNTFPYSFRIVHHQDIVPHIPPQLMPDGDEMFHHRTEIWYNNNMTVGEPFNVCKEADGLYCSSTQVDTNVEDHLFYFGHFMPTWGERGCP